MLLTYLLHLLYHIDYIQQKVKGENIKQVANQKGTLLLSTVLTAIMLFAYLQRHWNL